MKDECRCPKKGEKSSSLDIFQLLEETTEIQKKKQGEELLTSLGVEEFFAEGSITVNKRTCQGVECKLCVEACPTNALFWRAGEVGITPRSSGNSRLRSFPIFTFL